MQNTILKLNSLYLETHLNLTLLFIEQFIKKIQML